MPLFRKGKAKGAAAQHGNGHGLTSGREAHQTGSAIRTADGPTSKPFTYAPHLSKIQLNVGGLPVWVFGLDELTPASSRALAPEPPNVCIAVHMHGRGGSADNEERIVRQVWDRVARSKRQYSGQSPNGAKVPDEEAGQRQREFLIVSFDARNHGHRMTNEEGQKGWKQGNKLHAMDLYSMIVGTAQDVSFLVDFLPAYLFPHDERKVVQWAVTGKSLGGHAAWHVLANDVRITIGVPFISCPSFANLMAHRAPKSYVSNGPPYVPGSLQKLVAAIDPASRPYDVSDSTVNPFWGKKICICSGQEDRLVPWSCAHDFVRHLVVGPPQTHQASVRLLLLEGVGHEVTETMIEEAGHWIFLHGILSH